jgi:sigma-B regulation protein RsbQ
MKNIKTLITNNVKVLQGNSNVVLYAHGFGCNQSMWDRVTPGFKNNTQVLFDYVGSGQSDMAAFDAEKYASLNGYAQDVLDVCDALGLTQDVIFVGHSVSCCIGILASIARPELFAKLVLLSPNPCFINHSPDYIGGFEKADLEDLLALMDQNFIGWGNYLAPVVTGQGESSEVTAELTGSFCSTDPRAAKVFARSTFFSDNRADLPKVTRPCLILQNRSDTLAPVSVGEFMHAQMIGSTLQVLEVHGHCAHMSAPALVIEAMQAFLATPAP